MAGNKAVDLANLFWVATNVISSPQLMGSVGDSYDKALAESFFASLECGLSARSR
jgi:hypothetical protein